MPSEKPTKPKGWHSRRHETPEAHQAAQQRYGLKGGRDRRRRSALRLREQQLTRYMLGDYRPLDHLTATAQERKLERAQAEVNTLRERVNV